MSQRYDPSGSKFVPGDYRQEIYAAESSRVRAPPSRSPYFGTVTHPSRSGWRLEQSGLHLRCFVDRFDVDQSTSRVWLPAAVNAMEISYQVTA